MAAMSTDNGQGSQNSPSSLVSDQDALSTNPTSPVFEENADDIETAHRDGCPCSHCVAHRDYDYGDDYDVDRIQGTSLEMVTTMQAEDEQIVRASPERSERVRHPRRRRSPHLDQQAVLEHLVREEILPGPTAIPWAEELEDDWP